MTLAGAATGRKASSTFASGERGLEIVDVALELGLPGIGDRADADRIDPGGRLLARVELGVEVGEPLAVGAALERIGAGFDRATLEAAEPFEHVLRPADGFSELAVADHVDAGLPPAGARSRRPMGQAFVIGVRVVRFARLLGAEKLLQGAAGSGCRHGS